MCCSNDYRISGETPKQRELLRFENYHNDNQNTEMQELKDKFLFSLRTQQRTTLINSKRVRQLELVKDSFNMHKNEIAKIFEQLTQINADNIENCLKQLSSITGKYSEAVQFVISMNGLEILLKILSSHPSSDAAVSILEVFHDISISQSEHVTALAVSGLLNSFKILAHCNDSRVQAEMFYILGNIALDSSDLTLFCLQQDVVPSIVFLLADEHTHSQVVSAVLFALSRLCKNGLLVDREIERKENEKDIIGNTQCSNSIATETYDSLTSEEIQLAHESGEDVSVDASNSESKDLTTEQYLWAIEAARVKKAFTSAEIDLCQSIHSLAAVKDGSANPIATAAFQQDSSTDAFSPMTSDEAGATSTADSASQEIPPSYHKLLEAAMSGESSSNALSISHSMQLLSTVPLISSFLYGEDLDRAADSLFALMFLSASSHYAKEFIVNQQLLSIIAELMISSKNNGILLYGVRIFSTISTGPASYTQALFDASGLDALDLCLWRQDEEVSFMAMATLHTLSFGHIRHLVLIGTHKVFQSMCDLINSLSFPHIQLMLPVIEKILRSSLTACIVALKGDIVISLIHLLRTMCPSAAASSSIEMEREGNTVTLKKTDRPNVAMPKLYPEDKDEIEISVNLSSLPANFLISLLNILVMLTNYCQQESDRLEKNRRLMMHKTRGRAIPSINPKKKVQISLGQKRVVIESPFESCDGKMEMDASEEEEEEDDDDDDDYGDESSNFEESEGELGEKKKFENRVVWQMRERGFDNELMELARHKNQNVKERAMLLLASIHKLDCENLDSVICEYEETINETNCLIKDG